MVFQGNFTGVKAQQTDDADSARADESAVEQDIATVTDANDASLYDLTLSYQGGDDEPVTSVYNVAQGYSLDEDLETQSAGTLPKSYTSPYVTDVREQGNYGTCWTFASCGAAEANIKKKYGRDVDLSEWQIAYFAAKKTVTDPLGGTAGDSFTLAQYLYTGGEQRMSMRSLASWRGFTLESKAPYETVLENSAAVLSDTLAYNSDEYKLKNVSIVRMSDTTVIKNLIMEYGACGSSYYSEELKTSGMKYYNMNAEEMYDSATPVAEYCDVQSDTNHAITIVGWDDNFSVNNFGSTKPKSNGAWYVKNSWGDSWGQDGYFWISYEDVNLSNANAFFYDVVKADEDYTYNYQYDGGLTGGSWPSSNSNIYTAYEANVYTAQSNEVLKAVGFYTEDSNYDCEISIYLDCEDGGYLPADGKAAVTVSDYETYAGFHTVTLPQAVSLKKGTKFSVVVKQTSKNGNSVKILLDSYVRDKSGRYVNISYAESGQSFLGAYLYDLTDAGEKYVANCRIKAFTDDAVDIKSVSLDTTSKKMTTGDTFNLTATISPVNTTDSKVITWTSSNPAVATVSGKGTDSATGVVSAIGAGTTVITATASNGMKSVCSVTVKVPAVTVSYRTHIQNNGWEKSYKTNGTVSGTSGEGKRLEAIQIQVSGNDRLGIQYVTHCQDYGWLSWSANGEVSGTSGEGKRLESIEIQLTGEDKDQYDVYYRVHAQNLGWLGWAKNGAPAGTAGYGYRLEAIQIIVVAKGAGIDKNLGSITSKQTQAYISKNTGTASVSGADSVHTAYQTHIQNTGWQSWKYDGTTAGTTGKGLRLEGINIKLTNKDYSGGICYTTHIQDYGWQGDLSDSSTWKKDGAMSGTTGEGKRLEAIKIKLTGDIANYYDVYYRVHAQNLGWMGWAKNGESAGTAGYGYRLEGIEIVLVPKGGTAPGSTANTFRQK
jgi:uncharacterized protein YjdB/C1A family cysteine protease